MKETVKDHIRLRHILDAIDITLNNKDRFSFDEIENDPIIFYGFVNRLKSLEKLYTC